MAKRKKYKLQHSKLYSPVVAIMGKINHTDYIPINYGTPVDMLQQEKKSNSKANVKIRRKLQKILYVNNK